MNGLVFTGGDAPDAGFCGLLADSMDIIVSADSGLICAENANIRPDWILGDMDSIDDISRLDKYPPDRVLRFPPDKDFTDTELALDFLYEKGCTSITIAGGGGGRLDHILAITALFEREHPPCRWFTSNEKIFLASNDFCYHLKKSSIVSLFPLGNGPWKAQSSGLKWPLDNVEWRRGFFGISNSAEADTIIIKVMSGRFMVIIIDTPPPPFPHIRQSTSGVIDG
ncbi:MAG: thiamine diphosphokinase [Treponema sp.]|jgi:thiamine pyrophosphokinase|nr:thiamine diphosphokinase [Treponema sp.]